LKSICVQFCIAIYADCLGQIGFGCRPDFDEQETAEDFRQVLDNRTEQFECVARSMLPGWNNHVRRLVLEKLFGAGIASGLPIDAQLRDGPVDMQAPAARQRFAHELASRERGNDFSRQC
jgi:hypothetical protein